MIDDRTAQRIASEWHGGQTSALYALASSGAIKGQKDAEWDWNHCHDEIDDCINTMTHETGFQNRPDFKELQELWEYCKENGPRGPVPGWYDSVIKAGG